MINPSRKIRRCIVHSCTNTNNTIPEKLFLTAPNNPNTRQKWCAVLKLDRLLGTVYCCEDHFNLQEDAENWMRYRLTGNVKLRLKKDAVPHIFHNSKNDSIKRVAALKLAQKRLVKEAIAAAEEKERQAAAEKEKLERFAQEMKVRQTERIPVHKLVESEHKKLTKLIHFDKGVQVKPRYRSRATQCCLKMPDLSNIGGKKRIIRKRGRRSRRRRKVEKSLMMVYESSDEECSTTYTIATPAELVETTLGNCDDCIKEESDSDEQKENHNKAIQVYARPLHRNKGVMCILPITPLKKLITENSKLITKNSSEINEVNNETVINNTNQNYFQLVQRSETPNPNVNAVDNNVLLVTPNNTCTSTDENVTNYNLNQTYIILYGPPFVQFAPLEIATNFEQTPPIKELKPDNCLHELKKLKLDNDPSPVKRIKQEVMYEDYKESTLLSSSQIKQETEDPEDEIKYFVHYIKEEPCFEEDANSNELCD